MQRSIPAGRVVPVFSLFVLFLSLCLPAAARAQNQAPAISGTPATSVAVGASYLFRPNATDADGDTLRFYVRELPAWASFDTTTGTVRGTPAAAHVGTWPGIRIFVTDGVLTRALPTFSVTVIASSGTTNRAPTISGTPGTRATVGQAWSFQPQAADPDGQPLTFSIVNRPSWASFSTTTGRLSGTPGSSHVGTYSSITIRVSDGTMSASLAPFSIAVQAATTSTGGNSAPTISGTPATTATVGTGYFFRPDAADVDGDTLRFYVRELPAWATFDTTTGSVRGTPAAAHVGTWSGIRIFVTDGVLTRALPTFSITVGSGTATTNRAPTISGTPATAVTVGQAYSFQPSASDPDGQPLTFSIVNRPSWASFNTTTGRLSGTPGSSHVGTYSSITIRVSDGTNTTSLAPFSIAVQAAATTETVRLRWTPPTLNTDGTPLVDLADFRVFYGQVSGSYDYSLRTGSAAITSVEIEGLAPGLWFFTVKAVNRSGVESDYAREASRAVP